jgi:hypothetical protein
MVPLGAHGSALAREGLAGVLDTRADVTLPALLTREGSSMGSQTTVPKAQPAVLVPALVQIYEAKSKAGAGTAHDSPAPPGAAAGMALSPGLATGALPATTPPATGTSLSGQETHQVLDGARQGAVPGGREGLPGHGTDRPLPLPPFGADGRNYSCIIVDRADSEHF